MDNVIEIMEYALEAYSKSDKIFEYTATITGKLRNALIQEGFTRSEAIEIIAHQGISLITGDTNTVAEIEK